MKFLENQHFIFYFCLKVYILRGEGVNAKLEKVYILNFFWGGPFPKHINTKHVHLNPLMPLHINWQMIRNEPIKETLQIAH